MRIKLAIGSQFVELEMHKDAIAARQAENANLQNCLAAAEKLAPEPMKPVTPAAESARAVYGYGSLERRLKLHTAARPSSSLRLTCDAKGHRARVCFEFGKA
ncbi:hypothetical protein [Bradyrhizobium guangdongense]